ncbi:MAG TPA: protein-export chaperone SecB, partial [Rhodocyclaceae bacterium]|nr:protein-export chaperone SecB [Rhodocyclaceae bacterium]
MEQNAQPAFNIEKLYVKDLSIEVPNAPQIFLDSTNPQVNVELSTNGKALDEGFYEVALTVTVTAKVADDKTLFLTEVTQAGVFQIRN